jgi:hypothetical protein
VFQHDRETLGDAEEVFTKDVVGHHDQGVPQDHIVEKLAFIILAILHQFDNNDQKAVLLESDTAHQGPRYLEHLPLSEVSLEIGVHDDLVDVFNCVDVDFFIPLSLLVFNTQLLLISYLV